MFGLHYLRSQRRSTLLIAHSCAFYIMLSATSSFQSIQSTTAESPLQSTPFGTLKTRRPYRNDI